MAELGQLLKSPMQLSSTRICFKKSEYALAEPLVHHLAQVRNILPDESTDRLVTAPHERILETSTQNGVTVAGILK